MTRPLVYPGMEERETDDERISREAAAWFVARREGGPGAAAPGEPGAFAAWIAADPRHRKAYAEIERLWTGAAALPGLDTPAGGAAGVSRRHLVRGATAGLAVLALGGAALLLPAHPFADLQTGTGERRRLALPDGSTVELSTATALSLTFDASRRRVTLIDGEAFFQVATDPARPFMVEAGGGATTALGTAFSVARDGGETRVSVAEHAVSVAVGRQAVRVEAGQALRYGSRGIGAVEESDLAVDLAWREGRLVFQSVPFARVVAALDRWRPGRTILMDRALGRRVVTVIVDVRRSDAMLATLSRALPVRLVTVSPYLTLIYPAG